MVTKGTLLITRPQSASLFIGINPSFRHISEQQDEQKDTDVMSAPPVELDQLVHCVVPHQRLAHKQHQVGCVDVDEVGQRTHQRLVVLRTRSDCHPGMNQKEQE